MVDRCRRVRPRRRCRSLPRSRLSGTTRGNGSRPPSRRHSRGSSAPTCSGSRRRPRARRSRSCRALAPSRTTRFRSAPAIVMSCAAGGTTFPRGRRRARERSCHPAWPARSQAGASGRLVVRGSSVPERDPPCAAPTPEVVTTGRARRGREARIPRRYARRAAPHLRTTPEGAIGFRLPGRRLPERTGEPARPSRCTANMRSRTMRALPAIVDCLRRDRHRRHGSGSGRRHARGLRPRFLRRARIRTSPRSGTRGACGSTAFPTPTRTSTATSASRLRTRSGCVRSTRNGGRRPKTRVSTTSRG